MRVSKEMILRNIAGEHILVPVGETALRVHGMVNLSESGLLLWERLQEDCVEEDLVAALLQEYDVDRATAATDVHAFLAQLDSLGVLER